jgi:hypothetical protein
MANTSKQNNKLKRLYLELNRKWFENKLPKDIKVKFSKHINKNSIDGAYYYKDRVIYIASAAREFPIYLEIILLHEMVHVKTRERDGLGHHGPEFHSETFKLVRVGAYMGLL